MLQVVYQPYKLGLSCQHNITKAPAKYVDVTCSNRNVYHRVEQAGKICNKCATSIIRSVNFVESCPCCDQSLEELITQSWICTHSNRNFDQMEIKCQNNENDIHEVPFKQKVCKICCEKIRAAFMFAKTCAVCDQKEQELLDDIENIITKPSYYYFEDIIKKMKAANFSNADTRQQIEHFCLASNQPEIGSKFTSEAKQYDNSVQYHQSKRYELYPKCPKHRRDKISVCNSCLVSLLNINQCPYGCPYEAKESKGPKTAPPVINETGFLCLYPKRAKDYDYIEHFQLRHIEEASKLDKWEGTLAKVKYAGTQKINQVFTLYAAAVQVGPNTYLYSGGMEGKKVSDLKTSKTSFFITIASNQKSFQIQKLPPMNIPRANHSLAVLQNFVYAVGGFTRQQGRVLAQCQRFNLSSKKWQKTAPLSVQRSKPNAFVFQGALYAMGGISGNQKIYRCICQRYNLNKNAWEVIDYGGFDLPFATGATALTQCWGMGGVENLMLFGGSNYEGSSLSVKEANFSSSEFNILKSELSEDMLYKRVDPALAVLPCESPSERIILVFGGVEQHESFLSVDALRLKVNDNKVSPFFIYDDVNFGSYRMLLRENHQQIYQYMLEDLTEQGFLTKDKLLEGDGSVLKSKENIHLIEKMWYGLGKTLVGFSGK